MTFPHQSFLIQKECLKVQQHLKIYTSLIALSILIVQIISMNAVSVTKHNHVIIQFLMLELSQQI